jgi:hypothetical protein
MTGATEDLARLWKDVSEIEPLRAEERLTVAAAGDPSGTGSTTTTVAVDLDPDVPVLRCDPRSRRSSKGLPVTLVAHAIRLWRAELSAT